MDQLNKLTSNLVNKRISLTTIGYFYLNCNCTTDNCNTCTVQTKHMKRYKIVKTIGDGCFGNVVKAINKETGEVVSLRFLNKRN